MWGLGAIRDGAAGLVKQGAGAVKHGVEAGAKLLENLDEVRSCTTLDQATKPHLTAECSSHLFVDGLLLRVICRQRAIVMGEGSCYENGQAVAVLKRWMDVYADHPHDCFAGEKHLQDKMRRDDAILDSRSANGTS